MPPKITPKNLHYDTTLPPFLQKLQSNYDHGVSDRDGRHESALVRNRPKRPRDAASEAEDAPVYIDEAGNVVDGGILLRIEGEDLVKKEDDEDAVVKKEGDSEEGIEGKEKDSSEGRDIEEAVKKWEKEKEKIAEIGGSRKRKVGRLIGEAESDDDDEVDYEKAFRAFGKGGPNVKTENGKDWTSSTTKDSKTPTSNSKSTTTKDSKTKSQSTNTKDKSKKKKVPDKKKVKLSFGDDE